MRHTPADPVSLLHGSETTRPGDAQLRRLAAATLMPGFTGTTMPAWIAAALDDGVGSVCIYGTNISSPEQLSQLMEELRATSPSVLLTLDEEGGDVTRLHYLTGSNQPGNAVLGRLDSPATTSACAAAIADELAALGFNLNLAPDVDVNSTATNPVIGVRSFGAEASLVAKQTAAWTTGLQHAGVAACAKHFPGHGDTATDSHLSLPTIDVDLKTLHERELVPFVAAIAAGSASIMTSHIMVPVLDERNPATFSAAILQDLLRVELGFTGAIITDALDMAGASAETGIETAAVRALVAGADLLCLGSETSPERYAGILDAIVEAVHEGNLEATRLQEAAWRVAVLGSAFPPGSGGTRGPDTAAAASCLPDPSVITSAFEIGPSAQRWLADSSSPALIQIDSEANMAVGHVPWGMAAAGITDTLEGAGPGAKIALLGRGLDEGHRIWALAGQLRGEGRHVIVVECGWPRGGADLVTFGASAMVAQALLGLLDPKRAPAAPPS